MYNAPQYTRQGFTYLYRRYKLRLYVTEFGFPEYLEGLKDLDAKRFDQARSDYYISYMVEVLKSIWEDGVDIKAAYTWSFCQ